MADHGKWISPTWGARLMDTRGPFDHRTRRINPDMSYGPQDRAYRLRWQRDQMLTPRDAATTIHDIRTNPDFIKARYNIFRRAWHAPFNWIEWNVFRKFLSPEYAYFTRFMITRGAMFYTAACGLAYYFMYNSNNWEHLRGVKTYRGRAAVMPGDPKFENIDEHRRTKPSDYGHDFGFTKNSPI